MRAHVPLAAEVAHDQDHEQNQEHHPERFLVSPPPATSLGEPAWEAFYVLVYVASAILVESAPRSTAAGVAAGLAFAAMIPWYLYLGRPVMRLDEPTWERVVTGWRGPIYLTGVSAGFGLRGMGERLRQVGGTLTVASAPRAGTTIRAEVPA